MLAIPLQPTPSQILQINLGGQPCSLSIYQKAFGLFQDTYVNGNLVLGGVICLNLSRIIRSVYFGFIGDFIYDDTQGTTDPVYTGLGARYQLIYLEASDLPPGVG